MCNETAYSESGTPIAPSRCKEYIALKEENARLREALKAVEWKKVARDIWECPHCQADKDCGHFSNCIIGNALKE